VVNSDPYTRFIKRAINDFEGTVAEFKRLADSLKQSGKSRQVSAYLVPPLNPRDLNAAPDGKAAPPVVVSPEPGREGFGDGGERHYFRSRRSGNLCRRQTKCQHTVEDTPRRRGTYHQIYRRILEKETHACVSFIE
jgi:hypothetical protein